MPISRPLAETDIDAVKNFTDRAIGVNYYTTDELKNIYRKSMINGQQCSLVLEDHGKIMGIRFTYPPGQWDKGKGKGLSPAMWNVPRNEVAYFQSIFVDPALTGEGWGRKLSLAAIEILRGLKVKAIVTHSWKESPGDSSGKYLRNLGFQFVASYPEYWKEVDYKCTRCGSPCLCTAEEMILKL